MNEVNKRLRTSTETKVGSLMGLPTVPILLESGSSIINTARVPPLLTTRLGIIGSISGIAVGQETLKQQRGGHHHLSLKAIASNTFLALFIASVTLSTAAAKVRTDSHTNDVAGSSVEDHLTTDPPLPQLRNTPPSIDEPPRSSENDDEFAYHDFITNSNYKSDHAFDSFDSADYVLGQDSVDYGRGFAFGAGREGWDSVTMVDGDLEPLEEEIPYFDEDSPTQVTASVGAPAHIPCMVRNLGSKSLSWIRHRDLHVLTVASFTFANDHRFSAHRDQATGDWVLVLRQPLPDDSGNYVCSISTKPVKTHSVKLNVVVPSAEMMGGREVFLDHGSTLNLTCLIHYSPSPPEFVLWYHRDKLVNYGGRGGRIEVETVNHDTTTRSSLLVRNATQWHSGRYACKPANARKVTILVHVLKSETPAAMQTTTSGGPGSGGCVPLFFTLLVVVATGLFLSSTEGSSPSSLAGADTLDRTREGPQICQEPCDVREKSLGRSLHPTRLPCGSAAAI